MLEFMKAGFANDIIVVEQQNGRLDCSAVKVRFPNQQDDVINVPSPTFWNEENVTVSINDTVRNFSLRQLNPRNESEFRFTPQCLKSMRLRPDLNDITFKLREQDAEREVKARLFLWRWDSRIVITDVDGTITKSDVLGMVFSYLGVDWTQNGVCHLFSTIENNGYKVIYLTGRPRYMVEETRTMLDGMVQEDEVLPKGPVIVSPDGWRAAIKREVLTKDHYKNFKIRMLKQIRELFSTDHPVLEGAGPFHTGFGNRQNDKRTYFELKIPCNKIFHLNHRKERIEVKCEKRTLAAFFPNNYEGLSNFVDLLFPQLKDCATLIALRLLLRGSKNISNLCSDLITAVGISARTDS